MSISNSKPFEVFTKPRHPRYNWDHVNAANHAQAVINAIAHDQHIRATRARKGFLSLRDHGKPKPRFGSLPKRQRPDAEVELRRLILRHIERTGCEPSRMKLLSLMANAAWIVKHVHSGNRRRWVLKARKYKRVLDKIEAVHNREGTPAAAAPAAPPSKRTSWRGLAGI